MTLIYPDKLGDSNTVGVTATSHSLSIISENTREIADKNLRRIGLRPVFSKYSGEKDRFNSSSIKHRVAEIHEMFLNKEIKSVFTAIGGYNSNQLLKYIDWRIIKNNPKIFCGFSDTTVLANAIYSKTSLVTYIGPHYSTFGQKHHLDYTIKYFQKCCFYSEPYEINPSDQWRDDVWWLKQEDVNLTKNKGPQIINSGNASGISLGGNLSSLVSIAGTDFFPNLKGSILFVEVTEDYSATHFDNELQTLILQKGFDLVKGLLIGRFQKKSKIFDEDIKEIVKSKKELSKIPVISNLDFGHTSPMFTFPIGGVIKLSAENDKFVLRVLKH